MLDFDSKLNIPHTLMCKREMYNELFILSAETRKDAKVENSTGLWISVIDLDTLSSEMEDSFVKKYTITYLDEDQNGSDLKRNSRPIDQKLTDIDNPHKIFININDTVLVIQSQIWIAIVPLVKDKLSLKPDFEFELQIIDKESVFSRYKFDNWIIESKFHPLSPYTLCILLNSNQFKMFDITDSLDIPFYYTCLRPNGGDPNKGLYRLISAQDTIVSFDFGNQCALSWQKLTCYFITKDGSIYYLTPLLPLNFGIEDGFIEKLAMNTKSSKALKYLTLIEAKKQKSK